MPIFAASIRMLSASYSILLITEKVLLKTSSPRILADSNRTKSLAIASHLLYDSDSAGMSATLRSIDVLLPEGANVSCLSLPEGEDSASFAESLSEEDVKTYFETKAEDFLDYMIRVLIHPEDEPIAANNAIRKVLKSLSQMSDAISRELYLKKLVKVCGIREEVLSVELDSLNK